jgi:integrase
LSTFSGCFRDSDKWNIVWPVYESKKRRAEVRRSLITATHADIMQRVYRRKLDTPKTDNSTREAALSAGLLSEIEAWRSISMSTKADAWVFPSERMTLLSKDNCWRRSMLPKLQAVGLGWANFQVMRRTHATLMRQLKADPKLVADQLGPTRLMYR